MGELNARLAGETGNAMPSGYFDGSDNAGLFTSDEEMSAVLALAAALHISAKGGWS